MNNQQLRADTIIELQTVLADFIGDRVIELENDADEHLQDGQLEQAKKIFHASRELNFLRHEISSLLHETWEDTVEEFKGVVPTPQLPPVTPLFPVEVVVARD